MDKLAGSKGLCRWAIYWKGVNVQSPQDSTLFLSLLKKEQHCDAEISISKDVCNTNEDCNTRK